MMNALPSGGAFFVWGIVSQKTGVLTERVPMMKKSQVFLCFFSILR